MDLILYDIQQGFLMKATSKIDIGFIFTWVELKFQFKKDPKSFIMVFDEIIQNIHITILDLMN